MRAEQTLRNLVDAVDRADLDAYAALFATNAVSTHPLEPQPLRGRDAILDSEQALHRSFTHVSVKVERILVNESSGAAEVVISATNTGPIELASGEEVPPTGRRIEVPSVWVIDVDDDGKIVAERDYFDTASMFRQLGLQE